MQTTTKARGSPKGKESPKKTTSVRPARQLKINSVEPSSPSPSLSPSSNAVAKTPKDKDRSPKVAEHKSPRTPISEKKRRPSKISELESQISKLQDDLKKVKEQLITSESSKREAEQDAEEAKRQLADVSSKLKDSHKQLHASSKEEENTVIDLQIISEEKEIKADSAALTSALDEICNLKLQLEKVVSESGDDVQAKQAEVQAVKGNLGEALSLLESMKRDLEDSRESEAQAQNLVKETLLQLEAAKETVNNLRADICRSTDAYNAVASELEQSRARAFYLEGIVDGLNVDLNAQILPVEDVNQQLQVELKTAKSEVRQLNAALEAAEIRYNEERSHSSSQIRNASQLLEEVKTQSDLREAELEAELKKASANIEDLKAHLMDKETELQGISEENESLRVKLEKSLRTQEVETELKRLKEHVADLRASLIDKETELQNMSEENEMLKLNNQEKDKIDTSRAAAEQEDAITKLGYMMEEVDKSKKKAARVAEQLEAAQVANGEMEAELRRLKVQSDQWRKAAEAAASMLSPGSNGKYVERTESLPSDSKYSPLAVGRRHDSPYLDDCDDESFKKKNGNVLKKFGVLWKKPHK